MDLPLVSIVILCYNYAVFLPEAIESALQQTYFNVELIVVDDGSTDETAFVCSRYVPKLTYYHKTNGGLSQSRNFGARVCHGEYVVFLDADDVLEATYVEECMGVMATNPDAAFVYTQMRFFGDVSHMRGWYGSGVTDFPAFDVERLKHGRNFIHASSLLRTAVVRQHPYDESNRTSWEDWDFYVTLAAHGFYGVLLDKPLILYRRHDANMTNSLNPLTRERLTVYVMRRHLRFFGLRLFLSHLWRLNRMRASILYRRLRTQGARSSR